MQTPPIPSKETPGFSHGEEVPRVAAQMPTTSNSGAFRTMTPLLNSHT